MAEHFPEAVRRLAAERGISLEVLAHQAWGPRGTSVAQFRKVMNGTRRLTITMAEAVADVLDVPPDTFAEYRLAKARQRLDERVVGLDVAYANWQRMDTLGALPDV